MNKTSEIIVTYVWDEEQLLILLASAVDLKPEECELRITEAEYSEGLGGSWETPGRVELVRTVYA